MKKNLIALAIVHVAALAGISGANAQTLSNSSALEQKNIIEINKTTTSVKNSIGKLVPISTRALRNFANTYRNVRGESWMKTKDGFSANFISDAIRTTIFYDDKGYWVASVKYFNEEKIPHEIRHTIKSTYYDYNIIYTQEVETTDSEGVPTYIVCLEDKTNIKLIRIRAGEMGVWKEFTKTN